MAKCGFVAQHIAANAHIADTRFHFERREIVFIGGEGKPSGGSLKMRNLP